jgi:hypothetical protein
MEKLHCKIRKDLVEQELGVPIQKEGKYITISGSGLREYRWDGETFQIFYRDNWWDGYSIDFDF